MSDDLVKRLVNAPADGLGTENLCIEAADRIEELEKALANMQREYDKRGDRIKELEAKLAEAVEEKLETIYTLNAWFDRRKLAHDAIDQKVFDAASGYLRTSRGGGMPQEESDLVLGVIQDMARLSVFADLFARTTLAELSSVSCANFKGQDDE